MSSGPLYPKTQPRPNKNLQQNNTPTGTFRLKKASYTVRGVPEDSLFALLQEKAKLSTFTEEFLVSEAMRMSDHNYELYVEKKHARAEGLEEGRAAGLVAGLVAGRAEERRELAAKKLRKGNASIEEIAEDFSLSVGEVLEIQKSLALN